MMLRRLRFPRLSALLPALVLASAFAALQAGTSPAYTAESLASFISNLTASSEYYRAITETMRWHFLFNRDDPSRLQSRELGILYGRAGDYSASRQKLYDYVNHGRPARPEADRIRLLISRTYEQEHDYKNAWYQLEAVRVPPYTREAYLIGLKKLEYGLKQSARPGKSLATEWTKLTNASVSNVRFWKTEYASDLAFLGSKLEEVNKLGRKSAFLTGLFSVIPGLNMLYLGKPRQGLVNFTAHAALIGLTWYEFDRKEYVGGTILGLTELSWYVYNFHNGFETMRRVNFAREERFRASFSIDISF